jgi:hypothetical protein
LCGRGVDGDADGVDEGGCDVGRVSCCTYDVEVGAGVDEGEAPSC